MVKKHLLKEFSEKLSVLTREELKHRRCHGNSCRDVGELDDKGGEQLDHDVRHLHRAHCKSHHTLLGTAVNEAGLEALNKFSLYRGKEINERHCSMEITASMYLCGGAGILTTAIMGSCCPNVDLLAVSKLNMQA